ncbi:MAG: hypothetical protein E7286_07590 [Lachnospiraceae bacterium]|nr:hypothetical protein [Lachnospiraceae bacterium]
MLRQQAFIEKNKMLKGGLHTHTTRSDGELTPEEAIKHFKANGYDFLAITDHRNYNFKDFAPEEGLTIIPGMEYDAGRLESNVRGFRCFHIVCIGPAKEDGNGYEQDELLNSAVAPSQVEFQPYLDEIHAKKNLTIYCHPQWSSTPARYFEKLEGNFAMEIWNSGCAIENDMDSDAAYWDELLGQGIKIFGVATDDGHRLYHHCKGWVMVNAENNINAILKALEEGAFYSSCGPEIYDFYVDEVKEKAYIECSGAAKIRLHCDGHPTLIKRSAEGNLTRAEFDLRDWTGTYDYARITVIDKDGKYAWTNPIFIK